MFVLLLVYAGTDALLIVVQALCLAGSLTWMWDCAVAQAFASLVPGALPGAFGFAAAFIARNALDAVRSRMADAFSRKRATELQDQLVEATYEQGVAGVQRRGSGSAPRPSPWGYSPEFPLQLVQEADDQVVDLVGGLDVR